ncbi:hypothetical protein B6F84_05800 [Acidianus manzaensis]|uniref:Sulfur reduction protein DsrE n=2 Tax=Acidianus manzaensis TaxID=282676 RepID=A0A1W6JZA6_9CREN|nr:hypothetical protein B6F84_05800 [Acidianus manzaensis]
MASQKDVESVIAVYSETGIFGVIKNTEKNIEELLSHPKIQVYACGVAMKMQNLTEKDLANGVKLLL